VNNVPLLNNGESAVPAGSVIRSYTKLRVTAVSPAIPIGNGDTLIFLPSRPTKKHRGCRITVTSMEVDRMPVDKVSPHQACGIELGCSCSELPQPGDLVYIVRPEMTANESSNPPLAFGSDNDGAC